MATKHQSKKRVWDDDSDTNSDDEMLRQSETNWPKFWIVESASEDIPLQKLSPFAVQKGFQAIAGTLKSIKRLGGVQQKGPGPKCASNKPIYWQTSQGLHSQDPELLSGSNQVLGPCWHVRGWDPGWTERSGCGWGELSDTEEGGEGDPHQHSFLDIWFPESPKSDYSRLFKSEGGLVCSHPDVLLQLQQVWPHKPRLLRRVQIAEKINMKVNVRDPSCALIAMIPMLIS